MPTLSLMVTAAQATRIQTALGSTDPLTVVRTPATAADIQLLLKNFLKAQTQQYESGIAAQATINTVSAETW